MSQGVAIAWAQVCEMRRALDGVRAERVPPERLTRAERKALSQVIGYVDQAAECVRRAQGLLAERAHLAGIEHPAFVEYRAESRR